MYAATSNSIVRPQIVLCMLCSYTRRSACPRGPQTQTQSALKPPDWALWVCVRHQRILSCHIWQVYSIRVDTQQGQAHMPNSAFRFLRDVLVVGFESIK